MLVTTTTKQVSGDAADESSAGCPSGFLSPGPLLSSKAKVLLEGDVWKFTDSSGVEPEK